MLILGNGESRKRLDVLSMNLPILGCNAIVRDFNLDCVVCCDKRMVKEALSTNVKKIYTRKRWLSWNDARICGLPELPYNGKDRRDQPMHWGSGPYAVLLGAKLSPVSYLAGFDLYGRNKLLNNIYKDTANYKTSKDSNVDPSYWIYQIGKVFELYSKRTFVILQPKDWVLPESWKLPNVKVDNVMYCKYNT